MKTLQPKFVEFIPETIEEGMLYISMKYKTVRHKCACGCGNLVITPITPMDWHIKYDGKGITLKPSIGNWSFLCESHYWIINNEVRWAGKWSNEEIESNRVGDRNRKKQYNANSKVTKKQRSKGILSYLKSLFC